MALSGLAAAADVDKTRVAAQHTPIAVQPGVPVQRILIKRVVSQTTNERIGTWASGLFCSGGQDIRFSDEMAELALRDFVVLVRRELTSAGYPKPSESVFGVGVEADTLEYEIGVTLTDLQINICGNGLEADGGIWMKLRWELFSPRERRVVYSTTTEGSASTVSRGKMPFIDLTHQAVTVAARNLLAEQGFLDNASRRAAASGPTEQPMLRIAKRAAGTQPIADNMPLLQSAVVTLLTGSGHGSGFYIHRDGWLLTNQHVVGDAKFVKVKLANGRELLGEVMRSAAARDVALVKTEAVALAPFEVAASEPRAGDDVYVLGSPIDERLASSVTRGVLSAIRESDKQRWLQSDVAILPGNSGGPMVGRTGAVVGLTSRGSGALGVAGLNFFVPINDALSTLRIEVQDN